MKNSISAIAAAASTIITVKAATVQLPEDFNIFFSNKITTEAAASLRFEDRNILLEDGTVITPVQLKRKDNIMDLREAQPDKNCMTAAAVGIMHAEKPCTIRVGMGIDWWFDCYCNGQYIFSTPSSGNGSWPPSIDDYVFDIPLRAGRNELVIFTRSGAGGWKMALGNQQGHADPHKIRRQPLPAEVLYGPYLTNPGTDSVTISYVVQGRQPMELEYRKKGNKIWKKMQLLRGGQLIDDSPVMRFDLKDLTPATVYEYRGLKRVGNELRDAEPDIVRTFKTFDKKAHDYSFWIMADTQPGRKCDKLNILRKILNSRQELHNADMFIHLGDFHGPIDDIELDIFDSFLKLIPPYQQIVPLRGNHEFDGKQAGRYLKYLASKDGKSYQAFKLGNVFFIVLDTGHHLSKDSDNCYQCYTGLNELDTLLEEQTAWLKEVVKTKDFADSEYRLVFGHVAPHSQQDSFNHMLPRLRKMTEGLFKGNPAKYPIDLWFAGHIHRYQAIPGTDEWQFPVITLGGGAGKSFPGAAILVEIKNKKLYITAFDTNGEINDKFSMEDRQLKKIE